MLQGLFAAQEQNNGWLTDELIALMLKQRKDAGTLPPGAEAGAGIGDGRMPELDESAFDEIETEDDGDAEADAGTTKE